MAEEAEDDEVVRRIPVRIRRGRADAPLYLFQYPLRPYWRPYKTEALEHARVRPRHRQVELKLGADVGPHYDEESPSPLTHITLASTVALPRTSYAVGVLTAGEEAGEGEEGACALTLVPLECCLQLRPSFSVIDELDAQASTPAASRDAAGAEEAESSGAPSSFAPVFRPAQTEKEIEARRNSHAYMIEQQEAEEWSSAKLFAPESVQSRAVCDSIFDRPPKAVPMFED